MTANQIAYFRAQEDRRHNMVSEALSKYNTDRNFESSIYGSDKSYSASIYSSDKHLEGTKYSADQSRAANQYSADRHYEGTVYSANQSRAASEYSANKNYEAQVKRAELSLEGTKYSADRNYNSTIQSNASRERIATADRIARANVDRANRALKDAQFSADFELRKFIADADAALKRTQQFKEASIFANNAFSTVREAGNNAMNLLSWAFNTIV